LRYWLCSSRMLAPIVTGASFLASTLGYACFLLQHHFGHPRGRPRLPDGIHLRLLARYEHVAIRATSQYSERGSSFLLGHSGAGFQRCPSPHKRRRHQPLGKRKAAPQANKKGSGVAGNGGQAQTLWAWLRAPPCRHLTQYRRQPRLPIGIAGVHILHVSVERKYRLLRITYPPCAPNF